MTQLEQFIEIIESAGLKRVHPKYPDDPRSWGSRSSHSYVVMTKSENAALEEHKTAVVIGEGIGNRDFFAVFYFDVDGTAIKHGIWE